MDFNLSGDIFGILFANIVMDSKSSQVISNKH